MFLCEFERPKSRNIRSIPNQSLADRLRTGFGSSKAPRDRTGRLRHLIHFWISSANRHPARAACFSAAVFADFV